MEVCVIPPSLWVEGFKTRSSLARVHVWEQCPPQKASVNGPMYEKVHQRQLNARNTYDVLLEIGSDEVKTFNISDLIKQYPFVSLAILQKIGEILL